jgi:uncharacterized protein
MLRLNAQYTDNIPPTVFYKIEKEGLKPSYLFGTMHLVCNALKIKFSDEVIHAIKKSDFLCMESDFDNLVNLMGLIGRMKAKTLLNDLLTQEELTRLDSFWLAHELKPELNKMYGRKPMFILSFVTQKYLKFQDRGSMELLIMELNRIEKVFDMPTEGFESIKYQTKLFDKIPLEEQTQFLLENIDKAEENAENLKKFAACYLNNDMQCVVDMALKDQDFPKKYKDIFLYERNERWIDIIAQKNKRKNGLFIAVGCGHLFGDKGLLVLFEQKGYSITPILNPFTVE